MGKKIAESTFVRSYFLSSGYNKSKKLFELVLCRTFCVFSVFFVTQNEMLNRAREKRN